MAERTDLPTRQPTPARPNRILAEPADVAACQRDYQAATDVRQTIARQDARTRR